MWVGGARHSYRKAGCMWDGLQVAFQLAIVMYKNTIVANPGLVIYQNPILSWEILYRIGNA